MASRAGKSFVGHPREKDHVAQLTIGIAFEMSHDTFAGEASAFRNRDACFIMGYPSGSEFVRHSVY